MPIAFQCHRCQGKFAAPDSLAGKQAKCQRCGAVVSVPLPSEANDPLADLNLAPLEAQSPLRPAAPTGMQIPWVLILAGGGVLVFLGGSALCLVVAVRMMWPSRPVIANRPPVARPNQQTVATSTSPAPNSNHSAAATPATPSVNPFQPATPSSSAAPAGSGGPGLPNLPTGGAPTTAPAASSPPPAPATSWAARPDPPPAPVEYKKGAIKIALPSDAELRLPHGPSHFILGAVRNFQKEIWEVIDLRTGRGIGKPLQEKLEIDYRTEAFSPDGRYLAAVQRRSGDDLAVGVWSFITGQMEQLVRLKGLRVSGPLRYAAAHQLVTLHEAEHDLSLLTLWDLQMGSKLREVPFPAGKGEDRLRPESLAVSPGGRYAALVMGNRLGVVDLKSGDPAGNALLPERPSSCEGAAFSPDGAALALLVNAGSGHRLFVVDFATGRIVVDHDYRGSLQHFFYDGPMLDWLPDKSGLVCRGHLLLEATTGEEVWIFPTTDGNPRRFIRDNEMLVLMRDRNQKVLTAIDVPAKEISKAMQAVREGGVAIDAALPPLTTADLFSAKAQTLPSGRTDWKFAPEATGTPPRGQDREVLVAKSGENLRRAMFAGPAAGKVVVQKEITPPAGPGRRPDRVVVIERFDLTTGQGGNGLSVPHVYQLAEVSPSGKFAVVALAPEANKYDRLDILGFAPKKHVVAWRPYAGEKEPAAAADARLQRFPTLWGLPNDPRYLAWTAMLDDEHLLTINTTGKLICWKLPECKAVYSFAEFGEPLALSAGRKYIAGNHFGEFRVFDAYTGQCVGDLESPRMGSRSIRGAFRADGEELIAVIDALTDKMLVRWDLKTGKLKQEVPVPAVAVSSYVPFYSSASGVRLGLEYRGPNHVMIDDQFLVDLEKRAVVWRYHLPLGHFAANSPDERTWYCVRKNNVTDQSLFLISMDTPSASVQQKSRDESLEKQLVLYPGMSVRVAVDLSGAGMTELAPTVEKAVVQGLESRGLKVDPAAPLVFSVVAAQRSTGEQIQVYNGRSPFGFNPFFGPSGQPRETVSQEELACRLSVSDSTGKVLWHMDRTARMRDFGSVRTDNAGEELRKEMVKSFENILAGTGSAATSLPRYIFADLETILAGQSQLGFHDESPPPPSALPPGGPRAARHRPWLLTWGGPPAGPAPILHDTDVMLSEAQFRELVSGRWKGPLPAGLRGLLSALELPYRAIVQSRNRRFDSGRTQPRRVAAPVISVGNLTVGGTGKTPLVAWLAQWFTQRGLAAMIISRGYKSRGGRPNDEALELAARIPGVPHLQNPDRIAAAEQALASNPRQAIILDDAFQHRRLARDLDIVLLDALEPFGYERLLPRGLLREPVESLSRAHVVALSRSDAASAERRAEIEARVQRVAPQALWLELTHRPRGLLSASGQRTDLTSLCGQSLAAFCGIGNPDGFRHTLVAAGLNAVEFLELPDHCAYDQRTVSRLNEWLDNVPQAAAAVCTQKDLVKIPQEELAGRPLWAVEIELAIVRGEPELNRLLEELTTRAAV